MPPRKLIIVEGPDGAGKSTLVTKLAESLGRPALRTGGSSRDLLHLMDRVDEFFGLDPLTVVDRCPHISDPIYRRAMGEEPLMPPRICHNALADLQPLIIYCRLETPKEMVGHMKTTGKEWKSPDYVKRVQDNHEKIVELYDLHMKAIGKQCMVISYDWKRDDYNSFLEVVKCAV